MMRWFAAGMIISGCIFGRAENMVSLSAEDPAVWQSHQDGGDAPAVSVGKLYGEQPSVRFVYQNKRGYGNCRLDHVTLPPESYGVTFQIFVDAASAGATMHLWLAEADGDMWMCPVKPADGDTISGIKGTWRQVFVPFSALNYQPRGDKQRKFLSINRMLMGFNSADQSVCVAGLSLNVRESEAVISSDVKPVEICQDPAGRCIAILREPGFKKQPGHADPERLAKVLQ